MEVQKPTKHETKVRKGKVSRAQGSAFEIRLKGTNVIKI